MGDLFRLDGRCALITGASSGLGRHFAQVLAGAGARVAVTGRRKDRLDEVVDLIGAAGGQAFAVAIDVRDPSRIEAGLDRIIGEFSPIDILINNAGVTCSKPLLEQTAEDWRDVIGTNLDGAWLTAQAVAKRMVQRAQGGNIVNIASILGLRVVATIPAYVASKAALIRLTEAMAIELARHHIRVNALAPGYLDTDLNHDFFASETGRAMIKRIPQRRLGTLADLDGPLLLLASDASVHMTGSTVVVDGGHSIAGI